ncbi:MAG: ATP-binding protein [Bacteroidota bacterium]
MNGPAIRRLSVAALLLLDCAVLALSCLNLPALLGRPAAPFSVERDGDFARVGRAAEAGLGAAFREGDLVLSWNGRPLGSQADLDLDLMSRKAGEPARVSLLRKGVEISASFALRPFFTVSYVVAVAAIGLLTWLTAVFLLLRRPQDPTALAAHFALVGMSATVMLAWEGAPARTPLDEAAPALFFLSYALSAGAFLHFALVFPARLIRSTVLRWGLTGGLPFGILIPTLLSCRELHAHPTAGHLAGFRGWFLAFHILLWGFILGALVILAVRSARACQPEERKKLRLLLWGGLLGAGPFFLFTTLPDILAPAWSIPETYTMLAFPLIPLAVATAVIRYNAFNIQVVVRRSTAYALVVAALFLIYATGVAALAPLVGAPAHLASGAAALLTALLFEPVRNLLHRLVDRKFFRVDYDFRMAAASFLQEIRSAGDTKDLADAVMRSTTRIIPSERVGLFRLVPPCTRLEVLVSEGFPPLAGHGVPFHLEALRSPLRTPVGLPDLVEPGVRVEPADRGVFERWGIALVFPILDGNCRPIAFLALGPRKSGARFSSEDVDLLVSAAAQTGLALERIESRKEVRLHEEEAARLAELNRLKTDFLSYVSHEFRTPLAAIRLFADLMEDGNHADPGRRKEFLNTIRGEADRLERMVGNVLDAARMEAGSLPMEVAAVDLVSVVSAALARADYRLTGQGFFVTYETPPEPVTVCADSFMLESAILNIIDNAVKYSPGERRLGVRVSREGEFGVCAVQDAGIGIPPASLPHIFQRFYRDPGSGSRVQGTGVGLSLVKHILDAHGGHIRVESRPEVGSTFTLLIPLEGDSPCRPS